MPSSAADSIKTYLDTSLSYMIIVIERELSPVLKAFIGAAVCINIAIASIILTPLMKPREYSLIGREDHLTPALANRPWLSKSLEVGRYVLSFLEIGILLVIIHVVGSLPSVHDWLMSMRKRCIVTRDALFIIE